MSPSPNSSVPTALIRDLQISIRESFSLPPPSPSPPAPIPSIRDALALLDDDASSARCRQCGAAYLDGGVAGLCVYCGEGYGEGEREMEMERNEISFVRTTACRLLMEALGLNGSEAVNLDLDSAEQNKERNSSKAGMTLSDLLDIKLAFSLIKSDLTNIESGIKGEISPTTYDLNLSGIDLDSVFKESNKEKPQIKDTKPITPYQVSSGNSTAGTSSFAKWEPDFGSQLANPSMPAQISVSTSENLLKTNQKKEISEIETQADEEFDEWQDFAGSRATQNTSDTVKERDGSSTENRELVKPEGDTLFDSKDQSRLSDLEGVAEISREENSPIENSESLNVEKEDMFDDWNAFSGSGGGENDGAEVKPESELPEQVHVKKSEPLTHEDNVFDDLFAQSGLSVQEEINAPTSGDLFKINMVKEAANTEKMSRGDEKNESFDDEWDDFAGSDLGQSNPLDSEEKSKTIFWDPLNTKKLEEPSNVEYFGAEEKTHPSSHDPLAVNEMGPSDRGEASHANFDDFFNDWKDSNDSSSVQARLPDNGGKTESVSDEPQLVTSTEQSVNIGASNAEDDDDFDDWKDFTSSNAVVGEKQEPSNGNTRINTDLWSDGVNGVTTNNISDNGNKNTGLSDGLLDFMLPSEVNGTNSIQDAEGSSDNWLDFAAVTAPKKTKSENLDFEKKDDDDLFDDWQAFTGSNQSVKPNSEITERNFKVGEQKQEELSEDWLDFTSSSETKESSERKTENNGVSDGWSNFTDMNMIDVKARVAYDSQDIDFGDFFQPSSSAASADRVNLDSSNGVHPDPLAFFSTPSNHISNSNVNSKNENATDIQKFLSQMGDLSFMLKDELSIPDKLHSK